MRVVGSALWLVWIGLALAVGACKQEPPPLAIIDEVRLSSAGITSHPWLDLGPDGLEQRGRESLERTRGLELVKAGTDDLEGSPWRASLEIGHVRTLPPGPNEGGARADVSVLMTLSRGGHRIRGEGKGEVPFAPHDPETRGEAFRRALEGALDDASRLLVLQLGAVNKSEEELIVDLSSSNPDVRDLAVRILTERKSAAAVEHLISRLDDEDRGVQLRVVGALVEIGDPAAGKALVDATTQREPGFVIQIAYALGELGGIDAEAYLFTASTGHPEAAVRRAATEALEQLRRARDERPTEQTRRMVP